MSLAVVFFIPEVDAYVNLYPRDGKREVRLNRFLALNEEGGGNGQVCYFARHCGRVLT